jgi:hypothetical protein
VIPAETTSQIIANTTSWLASRMGWPSRRMKIQ